MMWLFLLLLFLRADGEERDKEEIFCKSQNDYFNMRI